MLREFNWYHKFVSHKASNKSVYFVAIAFFTAFAVRAVPELLMGSYISGFDQLGYYVPIVHNWIEQGANFWNITASAPLLYALLVLTTKVGMSLVETLKLLAPLLHGALAASIYIYAYKSLNWSCKKSLFVALCSTLYFIGLRASWDMLRVQLGLIFIFVALIFLSLDDFKSRFFTFASILLVVISNQYTAVIILSIILFRILKHVINKERRQVIILTIITIPSVILFALSMYANFIVSPNFLSKQINFPGVTENTWFGLFGFSSYLDLILDTGLFVIFSYAFLFPLIIVGIRKLKNFEMGSWVSLGFVAAFSPFFFSISRYRWILLLIYPLSFYFVEGVSKIKNSSHKNYLKILGLILTIMSVSFVVLPAESSFPYYGLFPYYVPTSMLQNTVPLSDCPNLENALNWLNEYVDTNSCVITHTAFYGWEKLCLKETIPIKSYGYGIPEDLALTLSQEGFTHIFLIWWVNGSGLHGQKTVSGEFMEVYQSHKMVVYEYCPRLVA